MWMTPAQDGVGRTGRHGILRNVGCGLTRGLESEWKGVVVVVVVGRWNAEYAVGMQGR
jgi:hypothetical protein